MEPFETVEQLRLALLAFKERYNQAWLAERHGHRTPGRRPPGALAQHRSGCMITTSEVSKKPGAVHNILRSCASVTASTARWRSKTRRSYASARSASTRGGSTLPELPGRRTPRHRHLSWSVSVP